jgi:hypothetical protein
LEPQEALVVDVLDEEADLVGVGGYHDAHVVAAPLRPDHAAQGVGADLVGEAAELFARDLPLLLLPARHAGGLDQPPQQRLVYSHARSS